MVSTLTSFLTEAFEDHLSFLSVSVVINGQTLSGLPAEAEVSPNLDIGGFSEKSDGGVIVKRSELTAIPKVGTRITVDGDTKRISAINISAGNPLVGIEFEGISER